MTYYKAVKLGTFATSCSKIRSTIPMHQTVKELTQCKNLLGIKVNLRYKFRSCRWY